VIKLAVLKYGGDRIFRQIKPVMFGLIAGDMMFGALIAVGGGIYYAIVGQAPPAYMVWAG
jgi:hypothetical protein